MGSKNMLCDIILIIWCLSNLVYKNGPTRGSNSEHLKEIIRGVSASDEEGSVDIDEKHLQRNPECGYLPEKQNEPAASSRISNAEVSDLSLSMGGSR